MPYVILILCIIFINTIFPQKSKKPKNDLEINFNKQNITWNWFDRFNYDFSDEFLGLEIEQRYNSKLITPSKTIKNWWDENNFKGFIYKNNSKFKTGIYTNSWILSDNQTLYDNLFSNHSLGIKTKYSPDPKITISPYTGYQRDQVKSNIDWGWDVGVEGKYDDFLLDEYKGSIDGHLDYDFYPGRQNANQGIELNFETRFSPYAIDSVKIVFDHSNKQYYAPRNDKIINVKYSEKLIHNYFEYKLSNSTNLELQTILSLKNILDESRSIKRRNKLKIENRFDLSYLYNDFIMNFGFDTFQETQNNTRINTDSDALQSNLRTNINYTPSTKDNINLKLTLSKYQFDTPDSLYNNDDRDELRIVGELEYIRQFSSVLKLELEAVINFFHQIYIYKERSANNNWNRIFRLGSLIEYKGRNFNNTLKNEILANYTVYDFEQQFSQSQSYIFRKYILKDSLAINLLPRLKAGFNGRYEIEDKGSFFKSEFAQQILQSTESIFLDLFIRFKNIYLLDIDSGVAFYSRNDWLHIPLKRLIRDVNTTTPYLRIRYGINENFQFVSSASYVFSDELNIGNSTYTTGSLSLIHRF